MALALTASCRSQTQSFSPPAPQILRPLSGAVHTPIQHVVIIFQENRTTDYLFQGIRGADIATYAIDSQGDKVPLQPISLATPWDLSQNHSSFLRDYDNGKMDGFDQGMRRKRHLRPFGYGLESELYPYHEMA